MARIVRPRADALRLVEAVELPPSKSHAQRALLLAAFGNRPCRVERPGSSADVQACAAALRGLGAGVEGDDDALLVTPSAARDSRLAVVSAGESATTARMLGAIAARLGIRVRITGGDTLVGRPMTELTNVLRASGVAVVGDTLPLEIDPRGVTWPSPLTVSASDSSQPASGLILGTALAGIEAEVVAQSVRAAGYLEVTAAVARAFGHTVALRREQGAVIATVGGAREAGPRDDARAIDGAVPIGYAVPVDASACGFPIALAAIHGAQLVGMPAHADDHPDWDILGDVARIVAATPGATVTCADLGARPDTFPALAALAATRDATIELLGAPALRAKESDRIRAMAQGLRACGVAAVEERADGIVVRGPLRAGRDLVTIAAPRDHRVVMALALLGSIRPLRIESDRAVAKSWPRYWSWLGRHASVTRS